MQRSAMALIVVLVCSWLPLPACANVLPDSLKSEIYDSTRNVWIYTPPHYSDKDTTTYDLLLVFDGAQSLEEIPFPAILDSLIAVARIPPMIAVLVDDYSGAQRLGDLANQPRFVTFLSDELLPWIRERWRVSHDPKHSYLTGSSGGGLASAYVALERPDLFGNVLSQSGAFWRGSAGSNAPPFEWLTEQYARLPKKDIHFVLDVGAMESRGALSGSAPSILDANRRLQKTLVRKGYTVRYTEVPGGHHNPADWRERLPECLVAITGSRRGS